MKGSETDVAMYWTTVRVFSKKLTELLDVLDQDATWQKVRVERPLSNEWTEHVSPVGSWTLGLESTSNTLAALLKVDLNFDQRFEREIVRDSQAESKRLAFARDLLVVSGGLLAEFDAIAAKQMK